MASKEATARIKINRLLDDAGWRFFDDANGPANIVLEPNVKISQRDLDALGADLERTTNGFVDFLLLDGRGKPLIVLEAKSEDKNPLSAKEQARKYARSQNARFVILSNGNIHYLWDLEQGNPPFMSPKGGIKPHTRFQVQSKRSEVLFVDYIAEHLTPNGRAAIVVPEGIIFQSQSAYVALRKMLVENHLAAVISLPAGVFNPYSGVKTSILILDRAVAKASKHVAFFKIENDGFQLGAQRRAQKGSELPRTKLEVVDWLDAARKGEIPSKSLIHGVIVEKSEIVDEGAFILTSERYLREAERETQYPLVALGDVLDIQFGQRITKKNDEGTAYPVFGGGGESFRTNIFNRTDCVVISRFAVSPECVRTVKGDFFLLDSGFSYKVSEPYKHEVLPAFLDALLLNSQDRVYACARGNAQKNLDMAAFRKLALPMPPLDIQQEIVAEIEGYQRVIDGARAVLDNYRPHIPVHAEWPVVEMGGIAEFKNGLNFTRSEGGEPLRIVGVSDFQSNWLVQSDSLSSVQLDAPVGPDYLLQPGDVVFVRSNGNPDLVGRSMLVPDDIGRASFSGFTIRARFDTTQANPRYLAHFFKTPVFADHMKTTGQGASIRNLSQGILSELKVPLPDLETQAAIVAEIEAEQVLVNGNRDLITRLEKKIDAAIARVWGEAATTESL